MWWYAQITWELVLRISAWNHENEAFQCYWKSLNYLIESLKWSKSDGTSPHLSNGVLKVRNGSSMFKKVESENSVGDGLDFGYVSRCTAFS